MWSARGEAAPQWKHRQRRWAGLNHIWMKNIWTSLSTYMSVSPLTLGPKTDRRTDPLRDRPSAADDGSVLDALERDPRPHVCPWVVPVLRASLTFPRAVCGGSEGRQEGWMEGGDVLFGSPLQFKTNLLQSLKYKYSSVLEYYKSLQSKSPASKLKVNGSILQPNVLSGSEVKCLQWLKSDSVWLYQIVRTDASVLEQHVTAGAARRAVSLN